MAKMEKSLYVFSVIMVVSALTYPISRMAGAIFQINNEIPNSLKGTCVKYVNQSGYHTLMADPFRDWKHDAWDFGAKGSCWNEADLTVFLSSVVILGILVFLFLSCYCIICFVCIYQNRRARIEAEREQQGATAREAIRMRASSSLNRAPSHLDIDESIISMYRTQ